MNWKLIFSLSLFGLAMAFGTVYFIPMDLEPVLWLIIFLICAYAIAKGCTSKYFLNGFMVSIVNCVWIVAVHVLLYSTYRANHPGVMSMMPMKAHPYLANHPLRVMVATGPIAGAISGLVLGFFSLIMSRIVKKRKMYLPQQ